MKAGYANCIVLSGSLGHSLNLSQSGHAMSPRPAVHSLSMHRCSDIWRNDTMEGLADFHALLVIANAMLIMLLSLMSSFSLFPKMITYREGPGGIHSRHCH